MKSQLVALSVAAALSTATVAYGRQGTAPSQRPGFRTDVNLVLVDVHVTKDGRPVTDLTASDFLVLENESPQQVATFEFVPMAPPQSAIPREAATIAASRDLAADPRTRLLVVFMDAFHVSETHSVYAELPLLTVFDRVLAPTDLFGLMTPHTTPSEVSFTRSPEVFRRAIRESRRWGRRIESHRDGHTLEPIEMMYAACYPCLELFCDISPLAKELIELRRESFTLGALRDLVRYLGALREARSSVLLITEGWALDPPELTRAAARRAPAIGIGRGGRLGTERPGDVNVDKGVCEGHLAHVAQLDHRQAFRDLMQEANRNNVSFYTLDPGGLRVEGGHVDQLRTLADNTNGHAIVDTNDLAGGVARALGALSGYYLVGYYSTNPRHDGSYRSIRVSVDRSDIEVRARRGYRAWTADEVKAMTASTPANAAPPDATEQARLAALGRLARDNPSTVVHLHGALAPDGSRLIVSGELGTATDQSGWRKGAEIQILVNGTDGGSIGSTRATLSPNSRGFRAEVALDRSADDHDVVVRLRPADGVPLIETIRVSRPEGSLGDPLVYRDAGRTQPAVTGTWTRSERVHVDVPLLSDAEEAAARLLDRTGSALPVPVELRIRHAPEGRWLTTSLSLASLAPGDYTLAITLGETTRFVPIRTTR